jgi:hypothetical protein
MLPKVTGNSQVLIVSILSASVATREQKMQIREFFRIFTARSKIAHYGDWNTTYPMSLCGQERKMHWIMYDPESNPNDDAFIALGKIDCKKCKKILDDAGVK